MDKEEQQEDMGNTITSEAIQVFQVEARERRLLNG